MRDVIILAIALLAASGACTAQCENVKAYRSAFWEMVEEESLTGVTEALSQKASQCAASEAYRGGILAMFAEHHWNPVTKLRYFNRGTEIIDSAISAQPQNAEMRFIRYLIQMESPKFLGYRHQTEEDLQLIKKQLETGQSAQIVWVKKFEAYQSKVSGVSTTFKFPEHWQ